MPVFPDSAREAGLEGRVLVSLRVGLDGRVVAANVHHSTNSVFNGAALQAALRWRFEPATLGGRPVEATVYLPVLFRIEYDAPRPRRAARKSRVRGNR